MNTRYVFAVLIGIVLGISGCKDDDKGSLTLVFRSTFDGTPLVATDIYDYAFGQRIQFTRSEFYISNLRLVAGDGSAVELSTIELIDMTASTAAAAEDGVRLSFNDLPARNYTMLEFGLGVDSVLNKTLPADYPSSHPLSDAGRYWQAWSSYIFGKTEGNLDTLADGSDNLDLGWLYHTGTDAYYISLQVPGQIDIPGGGGRTIAVELDHRKLMDLADDPVDIKAKPVNHNPTGNEEEYEKFFNNYSQALEFSIQ